MSKKRSNLLVSHQTPILDWISSSQKEASDELSKITPQSTFVSILIIFFSVIRMIGRDLLSEILENNGISHCGGACPKCNGRLHIAEWAPRKLKVIFLGKIQWLRPILYCKNKDCSVGRIKLADEVLKLEAQSQSCPMLKRAACLLAVFLPYQTATRVLKILGLGELSPQTIYNWVRASGLSEKQRLEEEAAKLEELDAHGEESKDAAEIEPEKKDKDTTENAQMMIGADGVMVPFRNTTGELDEKGNRKTIIWREIKVGVVTYYEKVKKGTRSRFCLMGKRVVAFRGPVNFFGALLKAEALKQGLKKAWEDGIKISWHSDGGKGYWGIFHKWFGSYGVGVLDFYHTAENLWKGTAGWKGGKKSRKAIKWFKKARHQIRVGKLSEVITEIDKGLKWRGLRKPVRKKLQNLRKYLETHKDHMKYKYFRRMGMPIGSGFIESACKWLIQQRFKGVGMRWSNEGFDALLTLRCSWVNGRFDELFGIDSPEL